MKSSVQAVIVTYNRKEMLAECIHAILSQTVEVGKVYIIDNASTDGTEEYLDRIGMLTYPTIQYVKLDKNTGGAGGFHEGMKIARQQDTDWVWIMDDDVIPEKNCLEELLAARRLISGKVSFLASSVRGAGGEAMNVPKINRDQFNRYTDWYEYLGDGIVKIVKATFVSLLISMDAIKQCGLPWKEFFIWGDDSEYTQRLIRDYGPAYMVGKSKAVHKRASADALSIVKEENVNRIDMYYYYYRNNLIGFWEYETALYRFLCMGKLAYDFLMVLLKGKHKLRKMKVILKAFFVFVFRRYGYKSFRNRAQI